jgi:hypothetical protein
MRGGLSKLLPNPKRLLNYKPKPEPKDPTVKENEMPRRMDYILEAIVQNLYEYKVSDNPVINTARARRVKGVMDRFNQNKLLIHPDAQKTAIPRIAAMARTAGIQVGTNDRSISDLARVPSPQLHDVIVDRDKFHSSARMGSFGYGRGVDDKDGPTSTLLNKNTPLDREGLMNRDVRAANAKEGTYLGNEARINRGAKFSMRTQTPVSRFV